MGNIYYDKEEIFKVDNIDIKIEIKSLKELMDFIKKYGLIIVDDKNITIYDDYLN